MESPAPEISLTWAGAWYRHVLVTEKMEALQRPWGKARAGCALSFLKAYPGLPSPSSPLEGLGSISRQCCPRWGRWSCGCGLPRPPYGLPRAGPSACLHQPRLLLGSPSSPHLHTKLCLPTPLCLCTGCSSTTSEPRLLSQPPKVPFPHTGSPWVPPVLRRGPLGSEPLDMDLLEGGRGHLHP